MKVVFTGHYHVQDIAQAQTPSGPIFDVETGSAVTFPSPIRFATLATNGLLSISTRLITNINYDLGGQDFPTYSKKYIEDGLLGISIYMLTSPPNNLSQTDAQVLAPAMVEASRLQR